MKNLKLTLLLLLAAATLSCDNAGRKREKQVETLLSQMTQDEKLAYVGGYNDFYIRAVERLGIPEIKMSDGPQGLRNDGKATAMPCGIMLASTWNKDLAYKYGEALGKESRARGVHVLLGPGVNIYRSPLCGRNFEYFGEDPRLAAQTSVEYIKGVQNQGVVATIKHFAANNSEYDRHNTDSEVDERTLFEIYFPAFEAAVKEANTGAVMCSYNLLNGEHASQNKWLLTDVLRDKWGFEGVLMSDWRATYDCVEAVNAGLDLEMPVAKYMTVDSLKYFLANGAITQDAIDEKVRRILRMIVDYGFMEREQRDPSIPLNNKENAAVALDVAREGIVLLKNDNGILPLDKEKVKRVAVVGYNSNHFVTGGGSGWIDPFEFVSVSDGVKAKAAQRGIEVIEIPESNFSLPASVFYTSRDKKNNGLTATFYNNRDLKGDPIHTRTDKAIDFNWLNGTGVNGMPLTEYSVRWSGVMVPETTGLYEFLISGDDGYRLIVDGKTICDHWRTGVSSEYAKVRLQKGKPHDIRVEYFQARGNAKIRLESRLVDEDIIKKKLNDADIIVACFGFNETTEAEGRDRTFEMPRSEAEFMNVVFASGKPVVSVVNAGGNVYMQDWLPATEALLWAWYPGQEGGTAIAEILFGETNPSGKLPATFEKKWEDNPAFNSYHDPDNDKRVPYTEGIFVGYRGYEKNATPVQYPFGYGLSYTDFEFSDIKVNPGKKGMVEVLCTIKNTGGMAGSEVAQLYVSYPESDVEVPAKELKGYEKVRLNPGEQKQVRFELSDKDFTYYDVKSHSFVPVGGPRVILIGNSSQNMALKAQID